MVGGLASLRCRVRLCDGAVSDVSGSVGSTADPAGGPYTDAPVWSGCFQQVASPCPWQNRQSGWRAPRHRSDRRGATCTESPFCKGCCCIPGASKGYKMHKIRCLFLLKRLPPGTSWGTHRGGGSASGCRCCPKELLGFVLENRDVACTRTRPCHFGPHRSGALRSLYLVGWVTSGDLFHLCNAPLDPPKWRQRCNLSGRHCTPSSPLVCGGHVPRCPGDA